MSVDLRSMCHDPVVFRKTWNFNTSDNFWVSDIAHAEPNKHHFNLLQLGSRAQLEVLILASTGCVDSCKSLEYLSPSPWTPIQRWTRFSGPCNNSISYAVIGLLWMLDRVQTDVLGSAVVSPVVINGYGNYARRWRHLWGRNDYKYGLNEAILMAKLSEVLGSLVICY